MEEMMQHLQSLYQEKRGLDLKWEQEHLKEGRYTLNMVKIDRKVRDLYKKKRSLETEWAVHQRDNQRYTLDMVRIDNKIREVVNAIKQEEAKIANLTNKIEDAAPEVSVAT